MNKIDRISKIINLLKIAGNEIETRKKLHKTIYLLQALGEDFDYDYRFHHFGVFSPSLAYDLDYADDKEILENNEKSDQGYVIKFKNETGLEEHNRFDESIKEKAKIFLGKSPQFLEALSTIIYLTKKYFRGSELKGKFYEIKPQLKDQYKNALKMANEHYGFLFSKQ